MANPILDAARTKRSAKQDELDALLELPTEEARELNDDETPKFEELAKSLKKLDKQIEGLETEEARSEKATAASAVLAQGEAVVRSEPGIYRRDASPRHGEASYMRDLATVAAAGMGASGNPQDALARMRQNWKEIQRDAEQGENKREAARVVDEIRRWEEAPAGLEARVNPNTTDGTGGEFVPPLWLVNQYVPLARAGRVIANRMESRPLPPGTDSINLPKIKTGSTAAIQAAQADAVSSTDITTSTVTSAVNTIAGQQDVSLQLVEQSPISMDGVIFDDLSADYDMKLDRQVISGTGANGQHLGIFAQTAQSANSTASLNTDQTKINAVTCASIIFFDGAVTSFTQYRSIINGITNIETARYAPPTAIYAHPRRINSWLWPSDAALGRPLYNSYGRFNALGGPTAEEAEGVTGELAGLPVVKDANIPILCATGSLTSGTGDMIGVVRESDMILWEGSLRMRALPEVLSGTLQIRFQIYAYSAFMPHRFPPSTTLITGTTGLAAAAY